MTDSAFPDWKPKVFTLTDKHMARLDAGLCPDCGSDKVVRVGNGGRCRACGLTVILHE